MTSLNGVVQPQGCYLLTDGAVLDSKHVVRGIGGKVLVLDALQMAIGWNGYGALHEIEDGLSRHRCHTQAKVMDALPDVLRAMALANEGAPRAAGQDVPRINALVGLWDNGPQLWAIHSSRDLFGPRYQPFTFVRLTNAVETLPDDLARSFGRTVNLSDPASFDPRRDGLALLEQQRAEPWDDADGPHYGVGGFAHLTTVTVSGVDQEVLRWWPDRVGEPIDLTADRASATLDAQPAVIESFHGGRSAYPHTSTHRED